MNAVVDVAAGVFALIGGLFALVAALGLVRMPDVLVRMHASTKAGTLAGALILVAVGLVEDEIGVTIKVVAVILFLVLTAPLAAHMIGRAAVRTGAELRLRGGLDRSVLVEKLDEHRPMDDA